MNIILKQPNPSGAYPAIQSWDRVYAPEKFYEVADGVELSCGGFGTLTIENDIVIGFTPDEAAWNEWQIANPEVRPQPTAEEQLRADVDFLAIITGVSL